jgi:hypothetical protein
MGSAGIVYFFDLYRGFLEDFTKPSLLNLMTLECLFSLFNRATYIWACDTEELYMDWL